MMASAELKELVELAKEAGLEGTELSNFLRDERTRQREREKEEREREKEVREREEKEGERQREREKEEREHHREREKAESDALQREADRRHGIELAKLRVEDNELYRSGHAERNIGSMGSFPKLPSFDEKMGWLRRIFISIWGICNYARMAKGKVGIESECFT